MVRIFRRRHPSGMKLHIGLLKETDVLEMRTASISACSLFISLVMKAVRISETSVYFNETSRRCVSQSCLHTCRRENLKSCNFIFCFHSDNNKYRDEFFEAGQVKHTGCMSLMKCFIFCVENYKHSNSAKGQSLRDLWRTN
jgi:hypothetical protein